MHNLTESALDSNAIKQNSHVLAHEDEAQLQRKYVASMYHLIINFNCPGN